MAPDQSYPALLNSRLTPVYDLFARLFIPEKRIKRDLIAHARLAPGHRVLDVGAGTGTLAIMIKQSQPEAHVVALDSDPEILSIARQKASRSGVAVSFERGNAVALPYDDHTFDRVLSTLAMSLLSRAEKRLAVQESYRVLSASGELHIADFGPPHTRWGRLVAPVIRRFEPTAANLDGLLPILLREAGFIDVAEVAHYFTLFGTVSILSGQK